MPEAGNARVVLGALVVAGYTFCIAYELGRERRKSLYSRTAAIVVPSLHAGIFLLPLAMRALLPGVLAQAWLAVFALEIMIYAIGTAFIVLLMVKDHYVHIYRSAASTDGLTGLLNRRAFLEGALALCGLQAKRREAVSLLMFDLDHFKSVNDRFGHAAGDDLLKLFAQTARRCMRADDIIGRFGGEEFVAIVPGDLRIAARIAERIRVELRAGRRQSRRAADRRHREHRHRHGLRAGDGSRRLAGARRCRALPRQARRPQPRVRGRRRRRRRHRALHLGGAPGASGAGRTAKRRGLIRRPRI